MAITLIKPVNSTTIERAVYNQVLQKLYIQFTTNSLDVYCYENVSAQLWENFCQASSPGQFFNSYIRNLEFTVQEVSELDPQLFSCVMGLRYDVCVMGLRYDVCVMGLRYDVCVVPLARRAAAI